MSISNEVLGRLYQSLLIIFRDVYCQCIYIYFSRIGSLLLANPIKQDDVSKIKINPTCKCKIIICAWLMSSSVVPLEWRIIRATLEVRLR